MFIKGSLLGVQWVWAVLDGLRYTVGFEYWSLVVVGVQGVRVV